MQHAGSFLFFQLQPVGSSSLTRAHTWAPCIGVQSLTRWTTKEVTPFLFHKGFIEGLVQVEVTAVTRSLGPIKSNQVKF